MCVGRRERPWIGSVLVVGYVDLFFLFVKKMGGSRLSSVVLIQIV